MLERRALGQRQRLRVGGEDLVGELGVLLGGLGQLRRSSARAGTVVSRRSFAQGGYRLGHTAGGTHHLVVRVGPPDDAVLADDVDEPGRELARAAADVEHALAGLDLEKREHGRRRRVRVDEAGVPAAGGWKRGGGELRVRRGEGGREVGGRQTHSL